MLGEMLMIGTIERLMDTLRDLMDAFESESLKVNLGDTEVVVGGGGTIEDGGL